MKRLSGRLPALRTLKRFPGEIAGASLKLPSLSLSSMARVDSPAKSPGPH